MYTGRDATLVSTADMNFSVLQHWDSNITAHDSNLIQDVDQPIAELDLANRQSSAKCLLERSSAIAFVEQGVICKAVPLLCPHSVHHMTISSFEFKPNLHHCINVSCAYGQNLRLAWSYVRISYSKGNNVVAAYWITVYFCDRAATSEVVHTECTVIPSLAQWRNLTSQSWTKVCTFNVDCTALPKLHDVFDTQNVEHSASETTVKSYKASHLENVIVRLLLDFAAPIPRRCQPTINA